MVGALGSAEGWMTSTPARARGITVAVIAHALVVAALLLHPSTWRPAAEMRPIGVRLLDEARALPEAPALPEPDVRRPPLPQVAIPEVQVARVETVATIVAQPFAPQAPVAAEVAAAAVSAPVVPPAPPASAPAVTPAHRHAP